MKICYLCQDLGIPLDGQKGACAHVRGFIRALKNSGHEVRVVTGGTLTDAGLDVPVVEIPIPALFEGLNRKDNPRMTRALKHLWHNVGVERALADAIDQCRPDVVYERYSPFGVTGGILCQQKKIRHILEVNALLSQEGNVYRKQALPELFDFLEMNAFKNTNLIVTVSQQLRSMLIDSGVESSKIITITNGVDTQMFKAEGPAMREGLKEKMIIGFVGSLKPWHGLDMLADAFRQLACDPRYHLLIVGDGPLRRIFDALDKELPGRVTVTGGISHNDVPPYIRAMDIAVAPYPKMEQFYFSPLKVLEYMATGRAVVASRIGQLNELVRHGESGWLVEPGDVCAFIEAIRTLAENDHLRYSLGKQAAFEVQENHTWRQRVELFMRELKGEHLGEMQHVG